MSTLSAISATVLGERQGLPRYAPGKRSEIDGSARVACREQPQRHAIPTGEVTLLRPGEQPRTVRCGDLRSQPRAINLPALAADIAERAGKRRGDGPHEIVDLQRAARPLDMAILGTPAAEVLP